MNSLIDHQKYEQVVEEILLIHEIPNTDPERLTMIRELIFNVISLYQQKQVAGKTPQEIQ